MMPRLAAIVMASVRPRASSLKSTFLMCTFTVSFEMPSVLAISRFFNPWATSSITLRRKRSHRPDRNLALAAHHPVEVAPPEVFALTGGLKLPVHHHRSHQIEPQALEDRIVGRQLSLGPDGTSLEVPDIHAQHSPLT